LLSLRAGEGTERLAALASVPPAALRAYLEGQELFRGGKYIDATRAYERALAADSTFALAGMAHALATGWSPTTSGTSQGTDIAFRHRDKLGARDLILLEMWTPSSFAGRQVTGRERTELRERLVTRVPDRPEAWYLIGDGYFHSGAAYGYVFRESLKRAEVAFRRALELDPGITYIKRHLVDIAQFGDSPNERVPTLIDSLELDAQDYQLGAAIMRGDSGRVKRLIADFPTLDVNTLLSSSFTASFLGLNELGDSAFALATARPVTTVEQRGLLRLRWASLLFQGRPAAATRIRDQLSRLNEGALNDAAASEVLLAAIFADADTIAGSRSAAYFADRFNSRRPGAVGETVRVGAWGTGLWASYHADAPTLSRAIAALDSLALLPDSTGPRQRTALRADVLRLMIPGRVPDRAVLERADSVLSQGPNVAADTRAAMNLIVSRAFERLGDSQRALQAASRVGPGEILFVMGPPASLDVARLSLVTGDTATAITIYRAYLLGRRGAEPAQKKADEAIRQKLDELLRLRR
jgi:serine/threonine-protein kinase